MIFGNIKDKERYNFIDERILECFKYAIENNLNKFSTGTHEINGDDVFVLSLIHISEPTRPY